ncbi:hypothetical protein CMI37_34865 [Candidatus Pacearchaeota archaeon]|nr:hypothetical protein [Candidatus Pacearchaeota archaeon]
MVVGIESVEINGKTYVLKGPLMESLVEEFPDNERQTALQQLSDRRGKSSWLVDTIKGIGSFYTTEVLKAINVQNSLAETRFGEITNLPLVQDSTGNTSLQPLTPIQTFAGDIGFFSLDGANDLKVNIWNGATDTWDLTEVTTTNNSIVWGSNVLGDTIYAYVIGGTGSGAMDVWSSTAWTSGWALLASNVIASLTTSDVVRILTWDATTSIVGVFDDSAKVLKVYKNTDSWATVTVTALATISCAAFNSMSIYYDLSGVLRVLVGTDIGVFAINIGTADSETLVVDLTAQAEINNGLGMTVWNGQLIIPLGNGGIEGRVWTGGSMTAFSLSPDRLPSGWEGYVTASLPTEEWLLVAYGGNESGNTAHIFAIDLDHEWHMMVEHDTTNEEIDYLIISAESDSQPRLHFIIDQTTPDFFHVDDPLTNPRHKAIPCEASSVIIYPEFTGGFPNTDKLFLQLLVDAEDLSATNSDQYINVDYGLDDNTVDTDLGDFLSGDKDLTFVDGSSNPTGVSGKSVTLQLDLKRDASVNTDRSYVRSLELEYLVIPDRRETYEFVIDMEETALRRGGGEQPKDINDELNTIQGSKTMVTLSFDGRSQVYVIAEPKTVAEHDLETRFEIQGFSHRVDRYMKLVELL